jgi:hypothetical protein
MNNATQNRIDELTSTTATMRANKDFGAAYFAALEELGSLRKAGAVPAETTTYRGSYAGALAFFGGPVKKIPNHHVGGAKEWRRA